MAQTCRDCQAPVLFRRSAANENRWMILDEAPVPDGNIVLTPGNKARVLRADEERRDGGAYYLDHHVTCPDRDKWRKKRSG